MARRVERVSVFGAQLSETPAVVGLDPLLGQPAFPS